MKKIWTAVKVFFAAVVKFIGREFDVRDAFLIVGLIFLGLGLGQVYLPAAYIVVGAILVYVAIFGARLSKERPEPAGED